MEKNQCHFLTFLLKSGSPNRLFELSIPIKLICADIISQSVKLSPPDQMIGMIQNTSNGIIAGRIKRKPIIFSFREYFSFTARFFPFPMNSFTSFLPFVISEINYHFLPFIYISQFAIPYHFLSFCTLESFFHHFYCVLLITIFYIFDFWRDFYEYFPEPEHGA